MHTHQVKVGGEYYLLESLGRMGHIGRKVTVVERVGRYEFLVERPFQRCIRDSIDILQVRWETTTLYIITYASNLREVDDSPAERAKLGKRRQWGRTRLRKFRQVGYREAADIELQALP